LLLDLALEARVARERKADDTIVIDDASSSDGVRH
jgi:hypothetical protein